MKLETHLHSKNGSPCGQLEYDEILKIYKSLGYGGIILTEHYSRFILEHFFEDTAENGRTDRFLNNFYAFEKAAKSFGIKAFFGAELGFHFQDGTWYDLLAIGVDEKFFKDGDILAMDKKQLHEYCTAKQVFLAQAHPFRPNIRLVPAEHLDGAEVYNGASDQNSVNQQSLSFAEKGNLISLSGSDFHREVNAGKGGIIVPGHINSSKELAHYLKFNRFELIINGEVNDNRF